MPNARADLLFYLRIKPIYKNGYIKRSKTFLKELSNELGEAKSTCSNRIKSCVSKGFLNPIYKNSELVGYQIISYDLLYKAMGYERRNKTELNKRGNGFKDGSKILRLEFKKYKNKKKLLEKIQEFDIYQKGLRISHCKNKEDDATSQASIGVKFNLSCKGFSKILGYKSRKSGYTVKSRMKKKSVIDSETPKAKFIKRIHIGTYISQKKKEKINSIRNGAEFETKTFFVEDKKGSGFGFLFERQCSVVSLNKKYYKTRKSSDSICKREFKKPQDFNDIPKGIDMITYQALQMEKAFKENLAMNS